MADTSKLRYIKQWDDVTADIDPETVATLPLYVGLDLSEGDDLCAATLVWVAPDHLYVDFRLWVPRCTAQKYEEAGAGQYSQWEQQGDITLLDVPTIGKAVPFTLGKDTAGPPAS